MSDRRKTKDLLYSIYLLYWCKSTDTDTPDTGRTLQRTFGFYYYQLNDTPYNLALFICPFHLDAGHDSIYDRHSIKSLLRLYSVSIKTLFRFYQVSIQDLFRLY